MNVIQNRKTSPDIASKREALDAIFAQIDKQYGKGSVMLLGESPSRYDDVISTGSILINNAIGIGGFPRGRIIEIFGPEASGKTTLALQAIAQAQKAGGICAFIDAEHALDPQYAKSIGINIDDLIISQPDYGEQALDIAEMLIRSAAVDMVVVDSVAALVPKTELDGDMGDVHVGLQARLMSQALRKLTPVVHKSNSSLIFINQIRENIGGLSFGPKETTTGGKALKFYASLRIDIRRIEGIKGKNEMQIGNVVKIKIAKNKMAPPFKQVNVNLIFGEGISKSFDLLDAGLLTNVIKQSGAWFSFGSEKIGQGREAVAAHLKENNQLFDAVKQQVLHVLMQDPAEASLKKQEVGA